MFQSLIQSYNVRKKGSWDLIQYFHFQFRVLSIKSVPLHVHEIDTYYLKETGIRDKCMASLRFYIQVKTLFYHQGETFYNRDLGYLK